ncbi:DUF2252 domain-containing protein [Chitinophaga arvensicola]|uniref:Uncharacterized conserved protein, DUF2252 family n=1 Tax=Chitinophaga arvensicola TaxID=29529 RepID=A0A1I0RSP5_9BACT|nr:DUF2252 family protein [Chitinophaga arvensicola]SEW44311.1 Uncharacterized conserved protein, DUF2252 family [Chitinophaga arvensicola]
MSGLSRLLKSFNSHRLQEMIPFKYEAMAENIFRFYRGTCHLFYATLNKAKKAIPASPAVWICGDLHLENFGSYKADNKLVYFDLNDFDEAILAPAIWEVIRLVTSIFIAFDTLEIDPNQATNMAALFLKVYATTLCVGKAISIEPRTAKGIVCQFLEGAERGTYSEVLEKRTEKRRSRVVLSLKNERHLKLQKTLKKELKAHISDWIRNSSDGPYNYEVRDVVFRLAGTGSIGVKRYLFLLKSTNTKGRYLVVDMKQSFSSSLKPYIPIKQPKWKTQGERITTIQHRMQNMSASLLSTTVFKGESYVIQELQPEKDTINFKLIKNQYRDIYQVISDMAVLTASAQLRSSGMNGSATADELKFFGRKKGWRKVVLNYAQSYATGIKNDYRQFMKDYKNGVFS